jgi:hypothetical protein
VRINFLRELISSHESTPYYSQTQKPIVLCLKQLGLFKLKKIILAWYKYILNFLPQEYDVKKKEYDVRSYTVYRSG